jgi:hypothetical protein
MVFNACVDLGSDRSDFSRALSQVCRDWRTFIVSSPKYWATVKMQCGGAERDHGWTTALLKRSQNHSITFHLCMTGHFRRDEVKNALYRHAGRVRKLIIDSEVDVPLTVVWREFQLFMDLELFNYCQKDGNPSNSRSPVAWILRI